MRRGHVVVEADGRRYVVSTPEEGRALLAELRRRTHRWALVAGLCAAAVVAAWLWGVS